MKLEDAREAYYTASGKLSDVTRQLGLAGIAVVWIFRSGDKSAAGISWTHFLLWPLACFVTTLMADMLQYAYASLAWGIFHRSKERSLQQLKLSVEKQAEENFKAPRQINYLTDAFFWSKAMFASIGYGLLLKFLVSALWK